MDKEFGKRNEIKFTKAQLDANEGDVDNTLNQEWLGNFAEKIGITDPFDQVTIIEYLGKKYEKDINKESDGSVTLTYTREPEQKPVQKKKPEQQPEVQQDPVQEVKRKAGELKKKSKQQMDAVTIEPQSEEGKGAKNLDRNAILAMSPDEIKATFMKQLGERRLYVDFKGNKMAENLIGLKDFMGEDVPVIRVAYGERHSQRGVRVAERRNDGNYYTPEGKRVSIYTGDTIAPFKKEEEEVTPVVAEFKKKKVDSLREKRSNGRERIAARLKEDRGALLAFNQAYDGSETVKGKIKELIKGKNVNNPKTWTAVHTSLLSEPDYIVAMEKQEKGSALSALSERYRDLDAKDVEIQNEMMLLDKKLENKFALNRNNLELRLTALQEELDDLGRERINIESSLATQFKKENPESNADEFLASLVDKPGNQQGVIATAEGLGDAYNRLPLVDIVTGKEVEGTGGYSGDEGHATIASVD